MYVHTFTAAERPTERVGIVLQMWEAITVFSIKNIEIKELPPEDIAPFVVVAKAGRPETLHGSLADAANAAQSGDTIEIRGDGPFESGPVELNKKALSIRAAAGTRPTLRFVSADDRKYLSFIQTKAPLSLEGLAFDRGGDASKQIVYLIDAANQPLRMANCRLTHGLNTLAVIGDKVEIINCLICGDLSNSVCLGLSRDGYLRVANSCLFARGIPIALDNLGGGKLVPKTIRLDNSTVIAARHLCALALHDPDGLKKAEPKGQVIFEISRNYVHLALKENANLLGVKLWEQDLPDADALALLRSRFRWSENDNLYNLTGGYAAVNANIGGKWGLDRVLLPDLQQWHGFWKITSSKSSTGKAVFENGDRTHQNNKVDLSTLQPADFRLAPGSPGKGAGPGGTDLGADVDLVGPGEAYEKWKKTKEFEEWRKRSDALIATADGPFIIPAKDKRAETQHATLADAVKAAQFRDTIEIRGNGPFVTDAINLGDKALVIRAGTGSGL